MNDSVNNRATTLDAFAARLLEEKKIPEIDNLVKDELKADIIGRAESHINATIIANLPQTQLEEFERLLDQNVAGDELDAFCRAHIANLDEVIAAALLRFRDIYLGA